MALQTGLVALWPLNETSDGTSADVNRVDAVGGLELIDRNRVASTAGLFSQNAALFAASSSEYLDIADNPALSQPQAFSVWVRLSATVSSDQSILSKYNTVGNQREYRLLWNATADRFRFVASSNGSAFTNLDANSFGAPARNGSQWCWIYCEHNPGVHIGISVNAGPLDTASFTGGIFDGTSSFELARRQGTTYMDGALQQCAVWSTLKTSGERTEIYNSGAGLAFSSWDAAATIETRRRRAAVKAGIL